MQFYLDEHFSDDIIVIARNLNVALTGSHLHRNDGKTDDYQLLYAAAHGYCIVTRDREDFIALAKTFAHDGRTHAGILLLSRSLPTSNFVAIARALAYYARTHPDAIYPDLIDWLHPAPLDWRP